ncbi:MAG: solute carrier family 23 protein [Pseudomonadota bacterium]
MGMAVGMGLQHCFAMSSGLVLAAMLAYTVSDSVDVAAGIVRVSMIAAGIGTILQAIKRGPIGSGYLCPNLSGPAFLPASIMAAQTGGLSLVFGMTLISGVFQALLSRIIHRLRALLPPEVTGVIVTMVGISLVGPGVSNIAGIGPGDADTTPTELAVGLATLLLMFGLTVWGNRSMRLYSVLVGILVGYALAFATQVVPPEAVTEFTEAGLVTLPNFHLPTSLTFDLALLVPFLVAGVASTVKAVGDLSTAQKINDDEWVAPEMKSIRGGVLADALSVISAALLGGIGQSTSSSNLGVSLATGVTSRWIGFSAGAIFIVAAFLPFLAHVFVLMPTPVKGAVLVFVACFMIVTGLQLVMTRLMDARKIFVVGASIVAGLSVDLLPTLYADMDPTLGSLATSSLSLATITAISLNLIFRIGVKRRATLVLESDDDRADAIVRFMQDRGGLWGARRDIIERATSALLELAEALSLAEMNSGPIRVDAHFDQFRFDLFVHFEGDPMEFPTSAPDLRAAAGDIDQMRQLSGFIVQNIATKIEVTQRGASNTVYLAFEH